MSAETLDAALWILGIIFVICAVFRLWWVAALVTAGIAATFMQTPPELGVVFTIVGAVGLSAFAGTALGKFLWRRSKADPFDPSHPRDR